MPRLKEEYTQQIAPALIKDLELTNSMAAPKLTKITLNAGIGPFMDNREAVETFANEMAAIAGQMPTPRRARKSEAGFKIKQGDVVGYSVTLRGDRMWAFLEKFIHIVLPRVRDFNGLGLHAFDKSGNYSVGIKEHTIFPEVNPNTVKGIRSMQIIFSVSGSSPEKSKALLRKLGLPFKKEEK